MSARILVIHDQAKRLEQIRDCLEPKYEVTTSGGINDALALVKSAELRNLQQLPFDLVVTALHVDDTSAMTVFDFLKWMHGNPQATNVPIVLIDLEPSKLATYVLDSVRAAANALGATAVVMISEFQPDRFREQMEAYLPWNNHGSSHEADQMNIERIHSIADLEQKAG